MQDQKLTLLNIQPGIVKEQTKKAAEGFWTDADKVRFRFGRAELIGGWQNVTIPEKTAELQGQPRAIETVRALDGTKAVLIGTHVGLFSSDLSNYYTITPIVTTAPITNAFSTSVGSTRILVSVSAHGMTPGTLVSFTSAYTTIGGNILICPTTATSGHYPVSVIDANSFAFDFETTAAATSANTGGAATAILHYDAGLASNEQVGGWGTGVWSGAFGWGTSPSGTVTLPLRLWSFDLWGTEVMAVPSEGPLYLWQPQNGLASLPVLITAAPSVNQIVRVAPEARHVVLYGTHDSVGTYDPLLIRWCSSEDYTDWTPTLTNTAGDYRLPSRGSQIVGVARMTDKTLILTDNDLFTQNYIGSNDVFGFIRGSENCGLIGQNALVEFGGVAYWMSNNGQFFRYDGRVQPIPCTVLRYVFDNLLVAQHSKICAGVNSKFDEVIWFYPSVDSPDGENDRYVIYNTTENHWTVGTLARNAWIDSNTYDNPIAAGTEGMGLFYHEAGYADDTAPLNAYIETGFFDMSDGDLLMFSNKFVPDFSNIDDNDNFSGQVYLTLKARKYPSSDVITKGPYLINSATQKLSLRLRGREFALRVQSSALDQPWRLGEMRMSLEADGKR